MKRQILWFRRDLRITDSAILSAAKGEVLPIFIFDKNILEKLQSSDKRVTFIYQCVLKLKSDLKKLGLDLAIFYDIPKNVFLQLKDMGFNEILASVDFDNYSKIRDNEISEIIPIKRYIDSFIIDPKEVLKSDKTPYKVFTPFYKSLEYIWKSKSIKEFEINSSIKKINFEYSYIPSLESMGFTKQDLPLFLYKSVDELIYEFSKKLQNYQEDRDYFSKNSSSNLSVHLRFGVISPRVLFNKIKNLNAPQKEIDFFIRELFWREFYNYILYYFPQSEFENLNGLKINWNTNEDSFIKWCNAQTGVPIVDAAMKHLNMTGCMHNRLRMIVASYLVKNLLIDWRKGERYFASKLLDYEASSNIGSWQWAASTGVDSVPYFRVFNPYLQSAKFDKDAIFIKSTLENLKDIDAKQIHTEGALQSNIFLDYSSLIVSINYSRKRAIQEFKRAKML